MTAQNPKEKFLEGTAANINPVDGQQGLIETKIDDDATKTETIVTTIIDNDNINSIKTQQKILDLL